MRIYKVQDIKIGYYLTFISSVKELGHPDKIKRRCLKVQKIEEVASGVKLICVNIIDNHLGTALYIDNLFEHPNDEAYDSLKDLRAAYPEEFI